MAVTRYAFFDVDETLISLKSMFSFRDFYMRWKLGPSRGALAQELALAQVQEQVARGLDRSQVNRLFWQSFCGDEQTDVQQAARAWHQQVRRLPGYFIAEALDALQAHQREGIQPVFVSGSCTEILEPLAAELGVGLMLTNRLEVQFRRFTGKLLAPQTIGAGKRQAVEDFLQDSMALASDCYAYGDHLSDLPLLECVGHPRVVAGDAELMAIAQSRGWPVLAAAAHA